MPQTTATIARQLPATARLQAVMSAAGWEIAHVDLDLTGERPIAEIRLNRDDGRWILARVDQLGRATIERFQRRQSLGRPAGTKPGRWPLSPQIEDTFLGRSSACGARSMLRVLTAYVADNALRPIALTDVRGAWAAVMAAPLRLECSGAA